MKTVQTTFPIRRSLSALLIAWLALTTSQNTRAALYAPGDTVTNLTFIARRAFDRPDGTHVPAGAEVGIQDFPGRILFLEWFAVWCPFCQAAVPQVDAGIVEWYESHGGNPYGVEVLYLFVNQESASFYQTPTDNYIAANVGTETPVFNDYGVPNSSPVRSAFQTSGQPIFVAINALTNSPTHEPWELLINHLGYGDMDFSQEILSFRAIIDSVQPPVAAPMITAARRVGTDFEFSFQADADRIYRVEGTTNLVDWTTLWTVQGSNSPVQFTHTNAPASGQLYRVVTP